MKKVVSLILIVMCTVCACSCGEEVEENSGLTYYAIADEWYYLYDMIEDYNRYCEKNYDDSYKINIVEFDNEEECYTKMSTEIMAGKGPDIFSLDQNLPFDKLMKTDAFADVNELISADTSEDRLDLSEYNQTVMKAGQYQDKQYIVPLFYGLNLLETTESMADKYKMPVENGMSLTYGDIPEVFKNYFEADRRESFMYSYVYDNLNVYEQLFYEFINSYVDFENEKTYFDTEDFRKGVDSMEQIKDCFNENDEETLFDTLFSGASFTWLTRMSYISEKNGDKLVFYNGFGRNKGDINAVVQIGVAVNANSSADKKDKALKFIKYLLSEDRQEYYCGDKEGSDYAGGNLISHPVRNEAFEHSIEIAETFKYWNDEDESETVVNGLDNDYMQSYINLVRNITDCDLYNEIYDTYYSTDVIGDIVDNYLSGSITKEKLITQLTSATKIYFNE